MKITNKANLPKILYDVLSKDFYDRKFEDKVYSVSEIINPPKLTLLKRRHRDELVVDASDLFYQTWGNIMHQWLQNFSEGETLIEERLSMKIGDYILTGKPDLYFQKTIFDYKLTSVWSFIYKSRMEDWGKKLNLYHYLLEDAKFGVDYLKLILMFRDWNKRKFLTTAGYPKQCEVVNVELMEKEKIKELLFQLFQILSDLEKVDDDEIPYCSMEERWESPTRYAVMKDGRKSAVRVFDKETDALTLVQDKGSGHSVEFRKGEPKRCLDYCEVAQWCNFGRNIKQ